MRDITENFFSGSITSNASSSGYREIAGQEITNNDRCDRGLSAGPLGFVDGRGNSEFVVGIRSAPIEGDRTTVSAGAGIIAGSDTEKNFAEIKR